MRSISASTTALSISMVTVFWVSLTSVNSVFMRLRATGSGLINCRFRESGVGWSFSPPSLHARMADTPSLPGCLRPATRARHCGGQTDFARRPRSEARALAWCVGRVHECASEGVRKPGFEPGHPFEYQILSLARLPVPPLSRSNQPITILQSVAGLKPLSTGTARDFTAPERSRDQARRRLGLREALAIRGRTLASTFEMMSSSTGPREDARELMALLAGTRLIPSCTCCASSVE